MSQPEQQKPGGNALHRTVLCKYYVVGLCSRGEACSFAHGCEELRPKPDLFRTGLCKAFSKKGECKNGDECKFAHSRNQLRRNHPRVVDAPQSPLSASGEPALVPVGMGVQGAPGLATMQLGLPGHAGLREAVPPHSTLTSPGLTTPLQQMVAPDIPRLVDLNAYDLSPHDTYSYVAPRQLMPEPPGVQERLHPALRPSFRPHTVHDVSGVTPPKEEELELTVKNTFLQVEKRTARDRKAKYRSC
mmetsp:Transcript_87862/g.261998  ORF Transcript_87862/g.261998 Transcript_87862/m.261998 type:complete len:245 (-) Transcript_87862:51-785(-)